MPLKFSPQSTIVAGNRLYASTYDGRPVTPSDSVDLSQPAAGLYITGAGNVAVNLLGGGTATLTGLAAGQYVLTGVTRVLATLTTATGIFALN